MTSEDLVLQSARSEQSWKLSDTDVQRSGLLTELASQRDQQAAKLPKSFTDASIEAWVKQTDPWTLSWEASLEVAAVSAGLLLLEACCNTWLPRQSVASWP